ncbi:winged helix-turn-helix domain-containing protein [Streptomyces qinzhouensis]|uniref:Winged helix-turn-helix transcriptional regulator n=1 Tax=Streptomyces qinzhouensis TaxID=2599401 RepID=A0A5B8JA01_9ACTN|nr:winged helix-turn-helix domain-containing protein [Streptomyces qinzhouensis]QDY78177.1 winged helix-turn-helix transcriptional regulator [Streptomyces qinzhouensis]
MPTLRTALAGRTESIDHTLTVLTPRWTTWTLQTLRQQESMRAAEIGAAMPWNSYPTTIQILNRMHNQGLVQRLGHGTYGITAAGLATEPVHRALADWNRQNFTTVTADAERAEDVLARLRPAGTTATLAALDRHGPLTYPEVVESTGLQPSSAYQRLARLERDGLILRDSPGRGARYGVSPAAEQLGDVYAALASWTPASADPGPAPARPVVIHAQAANSEWAAVAVQRAPSLSAVPGLFSHPPAAQPLVPTAVTAISRPPRTR